MKNKILISGGGVAGAGLACAISRLVNSNEVSITVVEKETEQSLGSVRRGEVLRPEATKVIHDAGLMDYVMREKPVIRYSPAPEIWHTRVGKLGSIDYSIFAPEYPMLYLPHKQIVKSLHDQMKECGIEVIYGAESESVEFSGEAGRKEPIVTFSSRKREGSYKNDNNSNFKLDADLLIVADGATSRLRSSLGIPIEFYDYNAGYLMVIIERPKELEWGRHYLNAENFVGLFSLPGDRMRVAIEVQGRDLKKWMSMGTEALARRMGELAPILACCKIQSVGGFYHVIERHAMRYVSDRIALIGDAAHTSHPQLGQGMSMVFFDVWTLSKLILSNPDGSFGEGELKECYEEIARPHNAEVIRNARELTEAFTAIGKDPSVLETYRDLLKRIGFHP